MNKIDWTLENLSIFFLYIILVYAVIYYILIDRPYWLYNRIKLGKLPVDYVKKYGNDYTFYKQYHKVNN